MTGGESANKYLYANAADLADIPIYHIALVVPVRCISINWSPCKYIWLVWKVIVGARRDRPRFAPKTIHDSHLSFICLHYDKWRGRIRLWEILLEVDKGYISNIKLLIYATKRQLRCKPEVFTCREYYVYKETEYNRDQ